MLPVVVTFHGTERSTRKDQDTLDIWKTCPSHPHPTTKKMAAEFVELPGYATTYSILKEGTDGPVVSKGNTVTGQRSLCCLFLK